MDSNSPAFNEFRAYWQLSDELIASASKKEIAQVALILALQAAHYVRKYGEPELPDLTHLLTETFLDDDSLGLVRDGTEVLVGVLAMVRGVGEVDID